MSLIFVKKLKKKYKINESARTFYEPSSTFQLNKINKPSRAGSFKFELELHLARLGSITALRAFFSLLFIILGQIWVWPERLQTMHLLGLHNNFTTKTTLTRVRAVPRYSFSVETLEALNTMRPTIGIMPSGLPWKLKKVGCKDKSCGLSSLNKETDNDLHMNMRNRYTNNIEKHHQYIYTVPYSDHSCFSEIVEFVKFLCPNNIKGIVSSSLSYVDPCYHLHNIYGTSSLCRKHATKEERARVEGECKATLACDGSDDVKLKRKRIKQYRLCVHKTRVSLLRRFNRGAKITNCPDD
ncbi:putative DNA repair metallo-beta-lactamase [Helianthus annuus]|nr:putative DNA repair metallo-beta-lactamase [Helianthus annuus]